MTMPYGVEYIVSEEPEDYDVQITKKFRKKRNRNWTMVKKNFRICYQKIQI